MNNTIITKNYTPTVSRRREPVVSTYDKGIIREIHPYSKVFNKEFYIKKLSTGIEFIINF